MKAILHWTKQVSPMAQVLECMVVAEQSSWVPHGLQHHSAVIRPDTVVLEKQFSFLLWPPCNSFFSFFNVST
jgi:hypothetical protein